MMEFNVRDAKIADIEPISELFNAYRVFYHQSSDLAKAIAFITERLEQRDSLIFVAESLEGDLLGFTQLYPSFSSVSARRNLILNDLYVAKTARNQGVATQLMQSAKAAAIKNGALSLTLETEIDNLNAQRLYEALGYQREQGVLHYSLKVD